MDKETKKKFKGWKEKWVLKYSLLAKIWKATNEFHTMQWRTTKAKYTKDNQADKINRQKRPEDISVMPVPHQEIRCHRTRKQRKVRNLPKPPPLGS